MRYLIPFKVRPYIKPSHLHSGTAGPEGYIESSTYTKEKKISLNHRGNLEEIRCGYSSPTPLARKKSSTFHPHSLIRSLLSRSSHIYAPSMFAFLDSFSLGIQTPGANLSPELHTLSAAIIVCIPILSSTFPPALYPSSGRYTR